MGQRANLAIGNSDGYKLYYSHWCANTITRDLFWGPQHALDFVREQRPVDPDDGWLDTVWAEGGAVIDPEQKTLLLYGGEDVLYDVPLRRIYLKLLEVAWSGWHVRWAHEGIVGLAEYLGVDRARVIAPMKDEDKDNVDFSPPQQRDWIECICSIKFADDFKFYPLPSFAKYYIEAGPSLLEAAKGVEALTLFDLAEWKNDFLQGGFHLDVARKRMDFWVAGDFPNGIHDVAKAWPNWHVVWHLDRFEAQMELTESRLVMKPSPQTVLLPQVLEMLDQESKPVDIIGLAQRLREHQGGGKVEINKFALRDDRLSLESEERKAILARCLAALHPE